MPNKHANLRAVTRFSGWRAARKWLIGLGALGLVLAILGSEPIRRAVIDLSEMVRGAGKLGVLGFFGLYVLSCLLLLPRSLLSLLAGFSLGLAGGTLLAVGASLTSSACAFWLARRHLAARVRERVDRSTVFRGLDSVARAQPTRFTALWHLSLVLPFGVSNYFMGTTGASFFGFIRGAFLGLPAGTFLYVYMGTLVPSAARIATLELGQSGDAWRFGISVGGLAVTIAVMVWVTRAARRALADLQDPT